ncbi:MAG: hypothetical protein AB7G11_12085 [Phycisphaerales bacterium]
MLASQPTPRRPLLRAAAAALLLAALPMATPLASARVTIPQPQPAATTSLTPNAALYYWRTWYERNNDFLNSITDKHGYKASDPDWKPSDDLIKDLANYQGFIGGVIRASKIEPCDFGIAYEDGYMALLPHVSLMRQSARLLGCDARRAWLAGNSDEAGQRIAAIIRIARHTTSDHVAISSLVGNVLVKDALDELTAMNKAGNLTPSVKRLIADIARPLDHDDPFGVRDSIISERAMATSYIKRRLETDGVAVLQEMVSFADADPAVSARVKMMSKEQALAELPRIDQYFREVLDAWDKPNRDELLTALGKKSTAGDYGSMGQLLLPSMTKLSDKATKSRQTVHELLQLVTK